MVRKLIFICFTFFITNSAIAQNSFWTDAEIYGKLLQLGHYWQNQPQIYNCTNLLRQSSVKLGTINTNELVNGVGRDWDPRFRQMLVQTNNILGIGFLDAVIKAGWVRHYGGYGKFMKARGPVFGYANMIGILQVASALEYSLNQADNFWDALRYFLAQAAISNVLEHLGYWIYVNSSTPYDDFRSGNYYGWRGQRYPRDLNGNNDVPWMSSTLAGYVSNIIFGDPVGTVRQEAVFTSLIIAYIFSYSITPAKGGKIKTNQYTNFEFIFYLDGVDKNKTTGWGWGTKLGLKYNLPFTVADLRPAITFYQSPDLDARAQLSVGNSSHFLGLSIGTNQNGSVQFAGFNFTLLDINKWYSSFSFEKMTIASQLINSYFVGVGYQL